MNPHRLLVPVRSRTGLFLNRSLAVLAAVLVSGSLAAQTRTFRIGPDADTYISVGGPQAAEVFGGSATLQTYQYAEVRSFIVYVRFDLSVLPMDAVIEEASLTFTCVSGGIRTDRINEERFVVFGLLDRTGNTPQRWVEGELSGKTVGAELVAAGGTQFDTGYRVVSFDGMNESVVGGNSIGAKAILGTSTELVRFLEDRARAGAERCATFIVDVPVVTTDGKGYSLGSKENPDPMAAPVLELKFRRMGDAAQEQRILPGR